jgi:hypothetical protein
MRARQQKNNVNIYMDFRAARPRRSQYSTPSTGPSTCIIYIFSAPTLARFLPGKPRASIFRFTKIRGRQPVLFT